MKAVWNGTVIAASDCTQVVEGNHYFPRESVDARYLTRTRLKTLCPWKGVASYYDVSVDGSDDRGAAWTYRQPFPWIRKIREHVAFWSDVDVRP